MLPKGARIAVVSPSGISDSGRLEAGLVQLRAWGFLPELLPGARAQHRYLAGNDETRIADLRQAFSGEFAAVWMARGGYGLSRLLDLIDWDTLAPVPFFGFSDGTALLNALACRGRPALHAPVLHALAAHNDEASRLHLLTLLTGKTELDLAGESLIPGEAHGRLVGGNLCVLASLCGTRFQLDAGGSIVLLEEVGEAAYKVDRLLVQLRDSGALSGATGIVLGDFLDTRVPEGADWGLDDVFRDVLGPLGIPVLKGLPVGHGPTNLAVPLGVPAHLVNDRLRVSTR